jgi:hypothetical protein
MPVKPAAGYSGTPLLQKLGIKPGMRVLMLDAPRDFGDTLGTMPEGVKLEKESARDLDVIISFETQRKQMERSLPAIKRGIAQNGMIWMAWPKKAARVKTDVTEDVIRDRALAIGLVDVKVCAIDETWSGLKLVIPVKDRKKK